MPDRPTREVHVKFMGDLPALIGQRLVVVNMPEESTVGELLGTLSETYGDPFRSRVFSEPSKLHHYMVVFVNGKNMQELGGFSAKLDEGEVEVIMLPMFEGG